MWWNSPKNLLFQTRKSGRDNQNDSTTESDDMPSGSNSTEASQSIESEVKETGEETDEAKVWFGNVWFGLDM
jgi:hypothetical protein